MEMLLKEIVCCFVISSSSKIVLLLASADAPSHLQFHLLYFFNQKAVFGKLFVVVPWSL